MTLPLLISTSPLWIQSAQSHDGHSAESLGVNVTELKKSYAMWNGSPLPNYPDGQPEITILRIKIPKGLGEIGVPEDCAERIAEKSMVDTAFGTNPISANYDEVLELVKISIKQAR